MARIDTLKFNINDKEYESHVNVNKAGIFSVHLHWEVTQAFNLGNIGEISGTSKDKLINPILTAYSEYKKSKTVYSLHLAIEYKASNHFTYYENGHSMFNQFEEFYERGYEKVVNKLFFGYKVYCKEVNSLGAVIWHEAVNIESGEAHGRKVFDGFYVGSIVYGVSGKIIPYTKEAEETLRKAKEGIRKISEILFNFISQDEKLISAQLNKGNLIE